MLASFALSSELASTKRDHFLAELRLLLEWTGGVDLGSLAAGLGRGSIGVRDEAQKFAQFGRMALLEAGVVVLDGLASMVGLGNLFGVHGAVRDGEFAGDGVERHHCWLLNR